MLHMHDYIGGMLRRKVLKLQLQKVLSSVFTQQHGFTDAVGLCETITGGCSFTAI